VDVDRDVVLQLVLGVDPQLDEHDPEPLAVADHDLGGPIEVGLAQVAGTHQRLAQPLFGQVGGGADDLAVLEAHGAAGVAGLEAQAAALPAHVQAPENARQHPFREDAFHFRFL
jgi:hypothetical protein